jgi:hypothetical protein
MSVRSGPTREFMGAIACPSAAPPPDREAEVLMADRVGTDEIFKAQMKHYRCASVLEKQT